MKKLILTAVILAGSLFAPATAEAQIDIRVNIGLQPIWGPAGYDYVEYYYIPELDIYYYVPGKQFIYMVNRRWTASVYLPPFLRDFDFFRTRVVVLNEYRPYLRHREIRRRYANYWDIRPYITIRDIREPKYYVNIHHPFHKYWQEHQRERWDDRYRDRRDNDGNNDRYRDNRDRGRYNTHQDNRQDNHYNNPGRVNREDQRYNKPSGREREITKERERVGAGQGGDERQKPTVQRRETPKANNSTKKETPRSNDTKQRESSGSVYRRTTL